MKDDFALYYTYRVHEQRLLNQQQKIYFTGQARDQTSQCFFLTINEYTRSNMYRYIKNSRGFKDLPYLLVRVHNLALRLVSSFQLKMSARMLLT